MEVKNETLGSAQCIQAPCWCKGCDKGAAAPSGRGQAAASSEKVDVFRENVSIAFLHSRLYRQ